MADYFPLIKGKGFCPNPVAKFGIPKHADSASFPMVLGTQAHEDWWLEQIEYCINGYQTGGIYIPGRYYYYLNFQHITTVGRGNHFPDYVDIDLEFFLLVEEVKRDFKGIICLKGRRRGLSEKVAKGVIDHGYRFRPEKYSAGIVAGLSDYSEGFFKKVKMSNTTLPPEFRVHELYNDNEQIIGGYEQKTPVGTQQAGSKNQVVCRTMYLNPAVFKGEYLDDCVFEEAGEFKILLKGYSASKACFAVGTKMVGTPYVYGTGGRISSATKEFQAMWSDPDPYGLVKLLVPGQRMLVGFFIGSKNERGQIEENCPNIVQLAKENDLEREQIMGCEDVEAADEHIVKTLKVLSKAKNREPYYEYFLDNPRNEKACFLKFSGNNFDPEALANQSLILSEMRDSDMYTKYFLEWDRDDKGEIKAPWKINFLPVTAEEEETREGEFVFVREMPVPGYENLDVGGGDSYDQDQSRTSKSLGGFVVLRRRGHLHKNPDGTPFGHKRFPVLLIRNRPKRKEIFYDNCLKASVAYNLIRNTMFDASKAMVIKWYQDHGGEKFLSFRPKSFESANSEQTHVYGMLNTTSDKSKSQVISIAQSYVIDEIDQCFFPQIVTGFQEYDVEQKDSDWDEVDALMLALVRDAELRGSPEKVDDQEEDDRFAIPDWQLDGNGNPVDMSTVKTSKNGKQENVGDLFSQMLERGEL